MEKRKANSTSTPKTKKKTSATKTERALPAELVRVVAQVDQHTETLNYLRGKSAGLVERCDQMENTFAEQQSAAKVANDRTRDTLYLRIGELEHRVTEAQDQITILKLYGLMAFAVTIALHIALG